MSAGRTIRVSSGLAADIEAARPLGGDDGLPVLPVATLVASALGLAAIAAVIAWALRERPDPRPATRPETA